MNSAFRALPNGQIPATTGSRAPSIRFMTRPNPCRSHTVPRTQDTAAAPAAVHHRPTPLAPAAARGRVAVEIDAPYPLVGALPAAAWADMGTNWVNSSRSGALRVPSVLTRGEFNVLINPAHADLKRIRVKSTRGYSYDTRMWKA